MQSTTTACHSSNANASGTEKCGFMSGMKDNAAGLCGWKKGQIIGAALCSCKLRRESRRRLWSMWEVGTFPNEIIHLNILSIPSQPAWVVFASLHSFVLKLKHPLYLKIHVAICFHLAVWLHIWACPQEQLKCTSTEHREFKILQRHRASETRHMAHYLGYIQLIIMKSCCVYFFPNFVASKLVTRQRLI